MIKVSRGFRPLLSFHPPLFRCRGIPEKAFILININVPIPGRRDDVSSDIQLVVLRKTLWRRGAE
jgi:hypothetical protein